MDLTHHYRGTDRQLEKAAHPNCRLPLNKAPIFLSMSDLAKSIYTLSASSWQSLSILQSKNLHFLPNDLYCYTRRGKPRAAPEASGKLLSTEEQPKESRRAWWMPAMNRVKCLEPGSKREGVRHFSSLLNSRNYKQTPLDVGMKSLWGLRTNICKDIAFLCTTQC